MVRSSNRLKSIDWGTVFLYAILVIFGWINIYAAVFNEEHSSISDISQRYGKQLIWIGISIILIIIIFLIDTRIYEFLAYPFYLFAIVLLIAVLIFANPIHGARSWFEFGSIRFQPAEFAKVATALALARYMSVHDFKINRLENLIKVAGIILLPTLIIILQNDTGSAIVYLSFVMVLYREGLSPWFLLLGLLFIILFFTALLVPLFYIFIALPILALIIFHQLHRNRKITLSGIFPLPSSDFFY